MRISDWSSDVCSSDLIVLTGRPFTAEEALAWGAINRICADGRLMEEALETARSIAANAPVSVRQAQQALNAQEQLDQKKRHTFRTAVSHPPICTHDRYQLTPADNKTTKNNRTTV